MPTCTDNPSEYSKDQLRNLLISHNVLLPQGDQRKAVYLQLYLKHILPKEKESADFSSDDEDMLSENDLLPVWDHEEKSSDQMDLKSLSDSELKEQLKKHGVNPGPILPTTRTIYEKKLQKLLEENQVKENGGGRADQYSDNEDGFQVKNPMDMRCELNGEKSSGFDSCSQKNIPACLAAEFNQNLATLGDDFSVTKMLKQMERRSSLSQTASYRNGQESKTLTSSFQPDDTSSDDFSDLMSQSTLGMSATRRKPIKGAAGRPIQFRYDDIATRARMQEQSKEIVTEGKPQRLVSVRLQIVLFIIVAFIALVYITMESSPDNPFGSVTEDLAEGRQP
ncbi:LEM domain-containing protein 1 isoform X1 [Bufo gargarizans]|uniref:LEM domain-containing protein 1 isoform X1 n=1 Tax=Bufo gargarizans TaxID=30331 RepID=UPI001CF4F20D|nr:LEM domain-containing protein 1 isoform X1 [Bufo gargarizans]